MASARTIEANQTASSSAREGSQGRYGRHGRSGRQEAASTLVAGQWSGSYSATERRVGATVNAILGGSNAEGQSDTRRGCVIGERARLGSRC
jgi:hypothetical protein